MGGFLDQILCIWVKVGGYDTTEVGTYDIALL